MSVGAGTLHAVHGLGLSPPSGETLRTLAAEPDRVSPSIELREDVYRRLEAARADDETYSDALERLLEDHHEDHPLYQLTGVLSDEEAAELREHSREFRESLDEQFERYVDE